MSLVVFTGPEAISQAHLYRERCEGWARVCVPAVGSSPAEGLAARIRLLLAGANRGATILLAEPSAPLLWPAPARRQLERIALGLQGVVVGPARWLQGTSSCSPLAPLVKVADHTARVSLASRAPYFGGLGHWPSSGGGFRALLVGDRPSKRWPTGAPPWPFISARNDGCSWWLAEHLETAGIPEHQLYWVDAYNTHGERMPTVDAQKLAGAGFDVIVALGKYAAHWCRLNEMVFKQVHHPQYWKRFQHNKRYVLGRTLQEVLHEVPVTARAG